MMQALELLRFVKRHIFRQSDVSSEEIKTVASCLKALVGVSLSELRIPCHIVIVKVLLIYNT